MPLPPEVTVIHVSLLTTVQVQLLDDAVTLTLPVPPLELKDLLVGEMEYVQEIPSCVTVKVCPAIVIVPVRGLVPVLADTE